MHNDSTGISLGDSPSRIPHFEGTTYIGLYQGDPGRFAGLSARLVWCLALQYIFSRLNCTTVEILQLAHIVHISTYIMVHSSNSRFYAPCHVAPSDCLPLY